MIFINKNQSNQIVLTLCESSRLSNPFYLFEFTPENELEPTSIYWTQTDTSLSKNRYNQFELVEDASGSTTGGTANDLSLVGGQWRYSIYESTGSTLSISATTGRILETGRMFVDGDNGIQNNDTNLNDIYE